MSSTKLDIPLAETPQSITVINEDLFEAINITNYYEATTFVPGVAFAGNFGTYPGLSSRGYVVRGVNSFRLNGAPLGVGKPFDSIAVERFEFVKGGSGTTFGEGGPGGFLNLITRKPSERRSAEVTGQVGSFDYLRGSALVSGPVTGDGALKALAGVAVEDSDTYARFEKFDNLALYGVATLQPAAGVDIEVMAYHNRETYKAYNDGWPVVFDRAADGTILGTRFPDFLPIDFNTGQKWNNERFRLTYLRGEIGVALGDNHRLTLLGVYTGIDNRQRLYDLCCEITPAGMSNAFAYYGIGKVYSTYGELRLNGKTQLGDVELTYVASGEYRRNINKEGFNPYDFLGEVDLNQYRYDIPDPFAGRSEDDIIAYSSRRVVDTYSGSATIVAEIGRLSLTAGARYDNFKPVNQSFDGRFETLTGTSRFPDDNWAFRGAATYEIIPDGRIYYSYGETFEINLGRTCDGSVLPPETGRVHEIGYKQGLFGGQLLLTAAAYDIKSKGNLINVSQQACPGASDSVVAPGLGNGSRGFEIEAIGRVSANTNLIAGIAYVDSKLPVATPNGVTKVRVAQVPSFQATLFATYDVLTGSLAGAGVGFGGTYVGKRIGTGVPFGGGLEDRLSLKARLRAEAALYYKINEALSVSLNVKNIFDARHPQTPYSTSDFQNQWMEPRSFQVAVRAKL